MHYGELTGVEDVGIRKKKRGRKKLVKELSNGTLGHERVTAGNRIGVRYGDWHAVVYKLSIRLVELDACQA